MKKNSEKKVQCNDLKNFTSHDILSCASTKEVTVFWIYQSNQKKFNECNYFSKKIIFIHHIFWKATSNYGFLKNHTECYVVENVCLLEKKTLLTKEKIIHLCFWKGFEINFSFNKVNLNG